MNYFRGHPWCLLLTLTERAESSVMSRSVELPDIEDRGDFT
jgi:hypothetical protein